MPVQEGIKFTGLDEVERKLQRLPEKLRRKYLKKVLGGAAETFQEEAVRRVPKRKPVSGWMAFIEDPGGGGPSLKDNITYKVTVGKNKSSARVGVDFKKVHHAHLVEFGTRPHWIPIAKDRSGKKGWQHPGSQKHPFMRPAFDAKAPSVLSRVQSDLIKAVEKAAGEK